jgi:hypothetical protein
VLIQEGNLRRPPIPMLRVRHDTYFVRDCRTVAEVAELVDLALRSTNDEEPLD